MHTHFTRLPHQWVAKKVPPPPLLGRWLLMLGVLLMTWGLVPQVVRANTAPEDVAKMIGIDDNNVASAFPPVDHHAYPNNMTVIASITQGGQPVSGAEIGVFADNECRGTSVEIDGLYFITISGEGNGPQLDVRVARNGQIRSTNAALTYVDNAMIGTLNEPFVIELPTVTGVTFEPVSTATLESGWYQMRQVVGYTRSTISTEAPRYVFSAQDAKVNGADRYFFGVADAAKTDATAFVYVDNTNGKYAIRNINGKWGANMAMATDTKPAYSITQDKTTSTQYSVGEGWDDWNHNGANWNYIAAAGSAGNARFQFSKVSDEALAAYDIYTLEITGATIANVSSTNAANKGTQTVYNGGNFFFTAGTSLTGSDFNAPDVADFNKTITVDAANKKIVVSYLLPLEQLQTIATELLSHKGVGYPTESAAARTTLTTAAAGTDAAVLTDAIKAYKRSTADIQMPEDGKAYRIKVPYIDGKVNYLYSSTEKVGNKAGADIADNDKVFVCRKVDNNYVFVTNNGTYFVWAVSDVNDKKSYSRSAQTPSYVEQNKWTVEAATLDKGQGSMGVTDRADVFGYVQLKGHGKNYNNTYYMVARYNDAFVSSHSADKYYDANGGTPRSCFYQFEEVSYPNTVTFNKVSDVEGVSNLATFSAPFATVIPTGVKAYYVSTADNTKATMKAVDGEAIPANEGVILTSESTETVTMVPATDEPLATIENNKLGNSAGADKKIASGDNAYILAKGANGTAFYKGTIGSTLKANKAYLTLNVAGGEAISMNFGGNVTGINQIVNAEQNNAPVYDLTGRRVVRTVKGGLYIKGGNKFIAR